MNSAIIQMQFTGERTHQIMNIIMSYSSMTWKKACNLFERGLLDILITAI